MMRWMGIGALAFVLMACGGGGPEAGAGSADVISAQPGTQPAANPEAAPAAAPASATTIASCNGRKTCVDAAVLAMLFSGSLKLDLGETNEGKKPAAEVAAEWLAKENDGRVRIDVQTAGTNKWQVHITLAAGHETKEDEGDAFALLFSFTTDGSKILETEVKGDFAG